MAKFSEGDRVKVNGEKGKGEGTIIGMDLASGLYRVRFENVEAQDDKGNKVQASGEGYAPVKQITKRRGS